MTDFEKSIQQFMIDYDNNEIEEIKNEFSLQHALGYYLKKDYKVYFEENVSNFIDAKTPRELSNIMDDKQFVKKEIDIVAEKGNKRYAIELKYPRNGQQTEQLKLFVDDMLFMKQVRSTKKFTATYCLTWVDDKHYYEPKGHILGRPIKDKYFYDIFRSYEAKKSNKFRLSSCSKIGDININRHRVNIKIKWNSLNNRFAIKRFVDEPIPIKYYFMKISSKN